MGLENVKESIIAEGRAAAEQELAKARDEAKAILARGAQAAEEHRAEAQARDQAAVAALKRRELALAELEAKKLRLQAQKDLLARVRAEALDRLARLPPKQNEEYLAVLAKRSAVENPRFYARPQDRAVLERLGASFAGPVEATGGVVVESADGATREDLRYEYLLDEAWRESLGDVAGALFGSKPAPAAPGAAARTR